MSIGPAITAIGSAIGQAGTAVGNAAVGAAKVGGALAVSPLTIPMKAAGFGTAANAIGSGAGKGLAALTGANALQAAIDPSQQATPQAAVPAPAPNAIPIPSQPYNAPASMIRAAGQVGSLNQQSVQSVASGLGGNPEDVAQAFRKSPVSIILDAVAVPLAASPETSRMFQGIRGIVENIQDAGNIPKALEVLNKVATGNIPVDSAIPELAKTGVSLETMGKIMDTSKSLWELKSAPMKYKKMLRDVINDELGTADKVMGIIEQASKTQVPIVKDVAAETLGVDKKNMEEAPTLRQQAYTRLFPGASRADYKEFEAIYGPLVRQKQDPEMELAGLTDFDPWREAVKQYATSLGIPDPLEGGAQEASQQAAIQGEQSGQPAQQADPLTVELLYEAAKKGGEKGKAAYDRLKQMGLIK